MDKLSSVEHLHLQENVRTSSESDLLLGRAPAEQRVLMRRVSVYANLVYKPLVGRVC